MKGFNTLCFETISNLDYSATKLLKSIQYTAEDGSIYELPYALPTDYGSVPSAFWGPPLFLIPTGWWSISTFFHDAGFKNLLLRVLPSGLREKAFPNFHDEQKVNDLLLEMMQAIKPNPSLLEKAQMKAIYEGVTLGGWHAWAEDRA